MEGVQLTALALLVLFGSNWVSQRRALTLDVLLMPPPVLFFLTYISVRPTNRSLVTIVPTRV